MKTEYVQIFRGDFLAPSLKAVETNEGPTQFFYDKDQITEEEYQTHYGNLKKEGLFAQSRTIRSFNDNDEKIAEVSYFEGDVRSSLTATVKVDDKTFEYKQIRQKSGKLQVDGRLANSYMHISFGEEESNYIDRQPDLDDPLLTTRDEILAPYTAIMSGAKPLSSLTTPTDDQLPNQ